MAQNRLNRPTLPVAAGGTGRNSLPAGSLLASDGSSVLSSLAPGAAGNVLKLQGGSPLVLPGDRILQVVQGTATATVTITSTTTWIPTGLSCAITPLYADSRILVCVNQTGVGKDSGLGFLVLSLWRDALNLGLFAYPVGWTAGENVGMSPGTASTNVMDTPTITPGTPITYSTRGQVYQAASTTYVQWPGPNNTIFGVSTLVLMEVAGS